MPQSLRFVAFLLDEQRYALPLDAVERIVRAVAITALPKAPTIVSGAINVQGEIIPVLNLRRLNNLLHREIRHDDEFILAHFPSTESAENLFRRVALWVDGVEEVLECSPDDVLSVADLFSGVEHISGAIKRKDGMVLIQDMERALSSEAVLLDDVLLSNNGAQNDNAEVIAGGGAA